MELFTKKHIVLKIVIALVIVILFNFCAPTISNAGMLEEIGGTLLSPIMDLLVAIGDGLIKITQGLLMGVDNTLIKTTTLGDSVGATLGGVLLGILAATFLMVFTSVALIPTIVISVATGLISSKYIEYEMPDTFWMPVYVLSPEEMFSNKIAVLDVNFFNPNDYEDIQTAAGETVEQSESSASILQSTIGSWYIALRNFAIVALLSVLLYIGIRILFSSTSQDKAKYKEKLFSWIVALGLLFFMHYIMAFATTIVEAVTEGINNSSSGILVPVPLKEGEVTGHKFELEIDGETEKVNAVEFFKDQNMYQEVNGQSFGLWPTNLMGQVRLEMQMEKKNEDDDNKLLNKVGYTILYLMFVFYTIAFLFVYLKRLIMLAFLTMIAPLVAMTYPIDKVNDGNAQAFNMWLKEYVFNLLLQPLHLILYLMLVSSALEFTQSNMIYAIVALGFIFQADKIMRKFFGFEKASTLESGSAIGGAMAMWGISQLGKLSKLGSGKKPAGGDAKAEQAKIYQRKADKGRKPSELIAQRYGGNALPAGDSTSSDGSDTISTNVRAVRNGEMDPGTEGYYRNQMITRDELRERGLSEEQINAMAPLPRINRTATAQAARTVQAGQAIATTSSTTQSGMTPIRAAGNEAINVGTQQYNLEDDERLNRNRPDREIKPGNVKPVLKGIGATAAAGAKYVAPKAARLALKAGVATAGATLGVAGGLATADDSNIWKMGLAGAAGGWVAGSGIGNLATSTPGTLGQIEENAKREYTVAAYGEDAEKARQQKRSDELAKRDKARRKKYADELNLKTKKQIDEAMNLAQRYRESGIVDDDITIKAMKAEGFGEDKASEERIILASLAVETGDDTDKIEQIGKRLQERGVSEPDARKYTDGIRGFYNKV